MKKPIKDRKWLRAGKTPVHRKASPGSTKRRERRVSRLTKLMQRRAIERRMIREAGGEA